MPWTNAFSGCLASLSAVLARVHGKGLMFRYGYMCTVGRYKIDVWLCTSDMYLMAWEHKATARVIPA